MGDDIRPASGTRGSNGGGQRLPPDAAVIALAAAFGLFVWMDFALPPLETFSAAAIVALAWCGWLNRRASGTARPRSAAPRAEIEDSRA
jgi:hypothetical protein